MDTQVGQTKVDKLLSQFSQMYRNETYISESICPPLKVKEKTGKFAKYGKENFRHYSNQIIRAPGTRARTIDYSVSFGDYACQERSLEKLVPDEMANNQDDPYDAKRDATAILMDIIWGNQEFALSSAMSNTSILTQNTTLSGTDQWSDYVNSDPLGDIEDWIESVRTATGKRPNSVATSIKVFKTLKKHPDVREQLKYTNAGQISDSAMVNFIKEYFTIKNVYVGEAVYDSAVEGQTASLADIWGKHFWVFFQTDKPSLMQATFGYTFFDLARIVDTYREEQKKSDVVRQSYSYDQNLMDVLLAYFGKNVIA